MNQFLIFLKKNYKSITVSLILAFLLWLVVTTNKEYKTRIEVPLQVIRLAENKVLLNPVPDKVILEISGKGRSLMGLNFYKSSIDLELPEISRSTIIDLGDYQNRFNVATELGVEIVDIIEPKKLDLKVDQYMEVRKPVRVQSEIKAAPGYVLIDVKPAQDSVLVTGPQTLLERLNYLETEKVLKEDVKYPFRETVSLVEPREGIIQLFPNRIGLLFNIEQIVERTIYNVPIQIVGIPPEFLASPNPANVSLRIKGGENIITNLTTDELTVFFDFGRNYREGNLIYDMRV